MHSHSHEHHHHHHDSGTHNHAGTEYGRAFLVGILLNVAYIAAEIIWGFHVNSLALLADAGHNAGDVLGLGLSWGAVILAKRKPDARYTYGLQSSSILAALANAVLLLIACGSIGLEALQRFASPHTVEGWTVMGVAGAGIVVNGVTAWLFMAGRSQDLNIRAAFLHMASDAFVSLAVVISAAIMMIEGWMWVDPLVSLIIAVVIIAGTWNLLKEAFDLALHATPKHISTVEVRDFLVSLPEVAEVHDLHVWAMSTNETALSAHLLLNGDNHPGDAFLKKTVTALERHFRIGHSTLQLEIGDDGAPCALAAGH